MGANICARDNKNMTAWDYIQLNKDLKNTDAAYELNAEHQERALQKQKYSK